MEKIRFFKLLFTYFFFFLAACNHPQNLEEITGEFSRFTGISTEKIQPGDDPYPPILHHEGWEQPVPLEGAVNSAGLEDSPFITPDGKTLFIFYTPSAQIPVEKQINDGITGIYRSYFKDGQWDEPERVLLTKGNEYAIDGCPFYQDGTLWFCSIRAGNYRDIDFWRAEWNGNEWTDVANAGKVLNETYTIGEMHLDTSGKTLYFHRLNSAAYNGYDLFTTRLQENRWQNPVELDVLNSPADDSLPALSPDGRELWFTRTYQGTPAIFRSVLTENDSWGDPELILSQFAGEPSIDGKGNIYFTHHYYANEKMIEADIYIAKKK